MKAYMAAFPSADGDGYVDLNNFSIHAEDLLAASERGLVHRYRIGERITAGLCFPLGVSLPGIIFVFRTLDAARNWGLTCGQKGFIDAWFILFGEAEEARPYSAPPDIGEILLADAFTPREVVAAEGG